MVWGDIVYAKLEITIVIICCHVCLWNALFMLKINVLIFLAKAFEENNHGFTLLIFTRERPSIADKFETVIYKCACITLDTHEDMLLIK